MNPRVRARVWLKTMLAVLAGVAATLWVYHTLLEERFQFRAFTLAASFVIVYSAFLAGIIAFLLFVKVRGAIHEKRRLAIEPSIRELLASYAVVPDADAGGLRSVAARYPRELEGCLCAFLACLRGAQKDRFSGLACDLGLVRRWERQARSVRAATRLRAVENLGALGGEAGVPALEEALKDGSPAVRIEAARALARSGQQRSIELALALAVGEGPLVRALVAEDLRPYAGELCKGLVAELLGSDDWRKVAAALELIVAWQKLITIPGFARLLRSEQPEVRLGAFRALPYVASVTAEEVAAQVESALASGTRDVKLAAARAAARLRLSSAAHALKSIMHDEDYEVALAAAYALAAMGEEEIAALERQFIAGQSTAGAAAAQAIEHARTGRVAAVILQ